METDPQEALDIVRSYFRTLVSEAKRLEHALEAGRLLGRLNWLNNDGLFHDDELEKLIYKNHRDELNIRSRLFSNWEGQDWLHVVTEAYDNGGHTPLIENLVSGLKPSSETQTVAVLRSASIGFIDRIAAISGDGPVLLSGGLTDRAANLLAIGRKSKRIVLHTQRESRGGMPDDRIKKLDDLGFVWEPFKDQWVRNVKYLSEFRKKYGHCKIPVGFKTEDGFRLGKFVQNTRTASICSRLLCVV